MEDLSHPDPWEDPTLLSFLTSEAKEEAQASSEDEVADLSEVEEDFSLREVTTDQLAPPMRRRTLLPNDLPDFS